MILENDALDQAYASAAKVPPSIVKTRPKTKAVFQMSMSRAYDRGRSLVI